MCACACAKAGAGDCACACAKEKEKEKHLPNGLLAADALEHTLPSVYFEYSTQRVLINRVRGTCCVHSKRAMSLSLSLSQPSSCNACCCSSLSRVVSQFDA